MAEGESPNDGPNKATGGGLGERIPPPEQLVALGKRIAGRANAFSPGAMVTAQRGPPLLGFACLTRKP